MKVAIISDIHGNIQALEAVLADIKVEKCNKVFCLGDLAMGGPEPIKTIEMVKKLEEMTDFELIQGNTDALIANFDEKIFNDLKSNFPLMAPALRNDVEIISTELKEYLKNLPAQKELNIEGLKILLVHGSPRRNNENITPELEIEEVEKMLNDVDANVIFCGHTHVPCGYQTHTKQTVVNVGSVGRPFTPKPQACYVVAEFMGNQFDIIHKFIDYDNEKACEILAKRSFSTAQKLADILIEPELRNA